MTQEELNDWMTMYDAYKGSFLASLKSQNFDESVLLSKISKHTQMLADTFKECTKTRMEDGNRVPLILSDIMATNMAHVCLALFASNYLQGKTPDDALLDIKTTLYMELAAPLCMTLWDNVQKDVIDEALSKDL